MFTTLLLVWSLLLLPPSSDHLSRCGICACSDDHQVLLCAGRGLTYVPTFSQDILDVSTVLGLQRNFISVLPAARLNVFKQLALVDVRSQRTLQGCIDVRGQLRDSISVVGK